MPRPIVELTEEQKQTIEAAKELRKQGLSWAKVARQLGVPANWLRWRIDSVYRNSKAQYNTRLTMLNDLARLNNEPLDADGLLKRLALVPVDTRDLTARLMGDPIRPDPRRRALEDA